MSAPRRIVVLLAAALTLLGAPATALSQGAGDEQYSDPLAGSTQTTPSSGSQGSGSGSGTTETAPLGQTPPVSGGSTGTGSTGSGTATATQTAPGAATAAGELPNTGADPRVLALLGFALLLAGAGLRLRTRDVRI